MPPTPSPYRALPSARRLQLVTHAISARREARMIYIQRIVSRGGGFRAVTLQSWAPERLAREVVRLNAESASDELDLLQLLYVDLEPAVQITFLDAAGVKHEEGRIADELEPPYADADAVRKGADAVKAAHADEGMHYLRTIARYGQDAWPGINDHL
ncbi:MAG TPA: hypothetical protein VE869_15105 [Gemmatimonas sp.]|nr:hypothetical protein [Gemmatimonas sp.]